MGNVYQCEDRVEPARYKIIKLRPPMPSSFITTFSFFKGACNIRKVFYSPNKFQLMLKVFSSPLFYFGKMSFGLARKGFFTSQDKEISLPYDSCVHMTTAILVETKDGSTTKIDALDDLSYVGPACGAAEFFQSDEYQDLLKAAVQEVSVGGINSYEVEIKHAK